MSSKQILRRPGNARSAKTTDFPKAQSPQNSQEDVQTTPEAVDVRPDRPLTPNTILALQRAIGNQAVMRLIKKRRAIQKSEIPDAKTDPSKTAPLSPVHEQISGEETVQRLLGFEFETNFPASRMSHSLDAGGKAGESAQETTLRKYLTGRAYAKNPIHNFAGQGFSAEADHGQPSTAIEDARTNINYQMGLAALPIGTPVKQYIDPGVNPIHPKPGIVEYKTDAFEAASASGFMDMLASIDHLAKHLKASYAQIAGGNTANPPGSANWYVGVPPLADWITFGNRYGIAPGMMTTQRNRIIATLNEEIYPQITVGVLPQNIPLLFSTASHDGLTGGQDPNLAHTSPATSQLRVTDAEAVAQLALNKVNGKKRVAISRDTLGYMTLIAQYVFGSLIDATEHFAISKNLPIFLSKTPLTGAQAAIVKDAERPANWPAKYHRVLVDELWKQAAQRFNLTNPPHNVNKNTQGVFTKAHALQVLGTDTGADNFSQAIGVAPLGLDPHRYQDKKSATPGREIALEFRGLTNIHDADALETWVIKISTMIRNVNQNSPGS